MGGAVRDVLRGVRPSDYDWAAPDPSAAAHWLAGAGTAFPLDLQRGYWRAVRDNVQHDVVPLPVDLSSDLLRRDFTVNALALSESGQVQDPSGGLRDLRRRTLRMVSEANLRDDPVRLLRAARLATTLGFKLDAQTQRSVMHLACAGLPPSAPERVQAELSALLLHPEAAHGVSLLRELHLLELYLPELLEGAGVLQGGFHHLDVYSHNVEALYQLLVRFPDADLALRWAALLHDVAKPRTLGRRPDTGRFTFYGHAEVGAEMTGELLARLRYSRVLTERAAALVGAHMVHLPASEREARRFVHRRRALLPDLLSLMLADREAARGPSSSPASRRAYALGFEAVLAALEQEGARPVALLSGHAIMALLGLAPGPQVGQASRALAEAQALGDVHTPQAAAAFLRSWHSRRRSSERG